MMKGLNQEEGLCYFKLMANHYQFQEGVLFVEKNLTLSQAGFKLQSFPSASVRIAVVYHHAQFKERSLSRETSLDAVVEGQAVLF